MKIVLYFLNIEISLILQKNPERTLSPLKYKLAQKVKLPSLANWD